MKIFARFELTRGRLTPGDEALLLEGDWPDAWRSPKRRSLDSEIDGRYGWIDEQAAELAERFVSRVETDLSEPAARFAWLNVVKLRYLLVKLLRVVAMLSHHPSREPAACELFFQPGRDQCYRDLLAAMAERGDFELVERAINAEFSRSRPHRPKSTSWRRAAGRLAHWLQPAVAVDCSRVFLCGNPRLLAPIGRELVRRGVQPWWLLQRFAPRGWLRWRAVGGGLLACDETGRGKPPVAQDHFPSLPAMIQAGDDEDDLLGHAIRSALATMACDAWPAQLAESEAIARHFDRVQPCAVLLDQDGTPFNRAVIAAARERGIPTTVVQHGAPMIRFGYSPVAADRFCAWGETSARQLLGWHVPREQIFTTGTAMPLPSRRAACPLHARPPRFVLLATLAPADSRPDAVNYHLTRSTYVSMLGWALAAMAQWPGSQVVIKLHPRDLRSRMLRGVVSQFKRPGVRIAASASLSSVLRGTDCVLSCASSAGIEAAARGWPVIQLMPEGSRDLIDSRRWGLVGTARSQMELTALLGPVLTGSWQAKDDSENVFAASGREAAARIADVLLSPGPVAGHWAGKDLAAATPAAGRAGAAL